MMPGGSRWVALRLAAAPQTWSVLVVTNQLRLGQVVVHAPAGGRRSTASVGVAACWLGRLLTQQRVIIIRRQAQQALFECASQVSDFNLSKVLETQPTTSSTGGGAANPLWLVSRAVMWAG